MNFFSYLSGGVIYKKKQNTRLAKPLRETLAWLGMPGVNNLWKSLTII